MLASSLFEILLGLSVLGIILGGSFSRIPAERSVRQCAEDISHVLIHASQTAALRQENRRVNLPSGKHLDFATPTEHRAIALLPGCSIASAAFGVGGKSTNASEYYQSGVASPGRVLVKGRNAAVCRITQSLYALHTLYCPNFEVSLP